VATIKRFEGELYGVRGQRPTVETVADERLAVEIMMEDPPDDAPANDERLDEEPVPE